MKIKLFIVTYNNNNDLHNTLQGLWDSNFRNYNHEITIINNHSGLYVDDCFKNGLKIINNSLRPDFSTGHLARNWNQAIINGFCDLNSPDCDTLITCQDDTIFMPNWIENLLNLHEKYTFIAAGVGDNLCSYKAAAIKEIGLWDERFCNLGFQEADYFIRALVYNREKSSINDHGHGRILNDAGIEICRRPKLPGVLSEDHHKSLVFHEISKKVFQAKWGNIIPSPWKPEVLINPPIKSLITNYVYYPYFEKNINDLIGKNYLI